MASGKKRKANGSTNGGEALLSDRFLGHPAAKSEHVRCLSFVRLLGAFTNLDTANRVKYSGKASEDVFYGQWVSELLIKSCPSWAEHLSPRRSVGKDRLLHCNKVKLIRYGDRLHSWSQPFMVKCESGFIVKKKSRACDVHRVRWLDDYQQRMLKDADFSSWFANWNQRKMKEQSEEYTTTEEKADEITNEALQKYIKPKSRQKYGKPKPGNSPEKTRQLLANHARYTSQNSPPPHTSYSSSEDELSSSSSTNSRNFKRLSKVRKKDMEISPKTKVARNLKTVATDDEVVDVTDKIVASNGKKRPRTNNDGVVPNSSLQEQQTGMLILRELKKIRAGQLEAKEQLKTEIRKQLSSEFGVERTLISKEVVQLKARLHIELKEIKKEFGKVKDELAVCVLQQQELKSQMGAVSKTLVNLLAQNCRNSK